MNIKRNINYYLSNNAKQWWFMSAVDYYGGASATVGGVSSNGTLGIQDFVVGNRVNKIDGVKPVINLKQGSLKSGDGLPCRLILDLVFLNVINI